MLGIEKIKKKLLIYGSGESGSRFFLELKKLGIDHKVIGFVDSSPELQGKRCCDLEIFDTSILQNLEETSVIIATTTPEYIKQIKSTLIELGINEIDILLHSAFYDPNVYSYEEIKKLNEVKDQLLSGKKIFSDVIKARQTKDWSPIEERNKRINFVSEHQYLKYLDFTDYTVILDCGTFDGFHANLFSKISEKAKVFSFDVMGDKLVKDRNKSDRIQYVKLALSNKSGSMFFRELPDYLGGASYLSEVKESSDSYEVEVNTIDSWAEKNNIKTVSYIKTDLEASDFAALQGAEKVIKLHEPDMAISIYHTDSNMYEIAGLIKSMNPKYNFWYDHYSEDMDGSILYCSTKNPFSINTVTTS